MGNKELGRKLKQVRNARGWSVEELAEKIKMSPASIRNMEQGRRQIYAEDIIKISEAFNVTVESFFEIDRTVSMDQSKLLDIYIQLTKRSKDVVMRTAEDLLDIETNKTTLILPLLNQREKVKELDYFDQAAGMGTGQVVDYPIPEKMKLLSSQVPENADFVIRVYGDSMEPTFHSDDKLFIQKTHVLDVGDIGVFSFNGEQLVKEYAIGKLLSHNPQYPPIKIDENVFIQGKVVGKI